MVFRRAPPELVELVRNLSHLRQSQELYRILEYRVTSSLNPHFNASLHFWKAQNRATDTSRRSRTQRLTRLLSYSATETAAGEAAFTFMLLWFLLVAINDRASVDSCTVECARR